MKNKSLVLFGDSILGRVNRDRMNRIEERTKDLTVYNCAAGGQSTNDGLRKAPFIAQLKPDYVLICFGANDMWQEGMPLNVFEENYSAIMEAFSGSRVIVLLSPLGNDQNDIEETKKFNSGIMEYNKVTRVIAQRHSALIIDSEEMDRNLQARGIHYHDKDGIHLLEVGYNEVIQRLVSTLS